MTDFITPFWKTSGKLAVAAGILATLMTALMMSKKQQKVQAVRPTWEDRYDEDSIGI